MMSQDVREQGYQAIILRGQGLNVLYKWENSGGFFRFFSQKFVTN